MPANKPAKPKRKRCLNDNKLFDPTKPWSKFCCDNCRKEYHRYGSSYGPLKTGLHKAIDKKCAERDKWYGVQLRLHSDRMKDLESAVKRMAVEVEKLREKVDTDRGQHKEGVDLKTILRPMTERL